MAGIRSEAYGRFCNQVKTILNESNRPMTWTEVREKAKFKQKFPNNKWVRYMEEDIGLVREKTKDGRINWRLS